MQCNIFVVRDRSGSNDIIIIHAIVITANITIYNVPIPIVICIIVKAYCDEINCTDHSRLTAFSLLYNDHNVYVKYNSPPRFMVR